MMKLATLFTAAAAVGIAAPAAAQYQSYPYPQQTYPQYGKTYPGYGYQQGYNGNPVGQIIDQLLGNRYNVTDRQAVSQCATAAIAQAQAQYGGSGYNQNYGGGYNGPDRNYYNRGGAFRVTAISDVERRANGLRVRGSIGRGYGEQHGYGYQNRGYGNGDLSFRCNVDYRGAVTNVRVNPMGGNRRY